MAARRKPEGKSTPPEARARQRRRRRPPPCKRCAASARRRNCESSLRISKCRQLASRQDFFGERFETRIAVERFEQRVKAKRVQVRLTFGERFLKTIHGLPLVTQAKVNQADRVIRSVARRSSQLLQDLERAGTIACESLSMTE